MDRDNSSSESRATSMGTGSLQSSNLVGAKTISPFQKGTHSAFVRYCETHTMSMFYSMFTIVALIASIGFTITFSYRDDVVIGKQSSSLILSSGEGMISRINSYVIDLPDAECKGYISTFPNGRYSATLLGIVSEDSGDDFFRPKDCKWLRQVAPPVVENSTFPADLVGPCNAHPVVAGYTESITMVFRGQELLSASSLRGMCEVDGKIRGRHGYTSSKCRNSGVVTAPCCPSRSIGNYAAALYGLHDCDAITDSVAEQLSALLDTCMDSYRTGTLTGDCWDWEQGVVKSTQCPLASSECARYNAVFDILHSLANSVQSEESGSGEGLSLARLLVPYNATSKVWLQDLYSDQLRDMTNNKYGGAQLTAFDLRIKSKIFGHHLTWDALFLLPITFVCICSVLAHDHSLFAAIFVVLTLYMTFGMALFVVSVVLWISYLPFFIFVALSIVLYVGLGFFFLISASWKDSFDSMGVGINNADRMAYVWHHTSLKTFTSALCSRWVPALPSFTFSVTVTLQNLLNSNCTVLAVCASLLPFSSRFLPLRCSAYSAGSSC